MMDFPLKKRGECIIMLQGKKEQKMTMYNPAETIVKMSNLQIGDTVQDTRCTMPFGTATVKNISKQEGSLNEYVTFFRPYVHTSDFKTTAGVICYVGIEEYTVPIVGDSEYVLFERKRLA
jgi:hypothetical protein